MKDVTRDSIGNAEGRPLLQCMQRSRRKTPVRSVAEEEKEKSLYLLEGILSKLQAFCEKTGNANKEHKGGVPSAVNTFKQL